MGRELSKADNISSPPLLCFFLDFPFFPLPSPSVYPPQSLFLYLLHKLLISVCSTVSPPNTHPEWSTAHAFLPWSESCCFRKLLGIFDSPSLSRLIRSSPWALTCSSESKWAKNNKWINLRAVSSSNKTHPREIIKNNNCFFSLAPSLSRGKLPQFPANLSAE